MKKRLIPYALLFLVGGLLAWQGPKPIPPFEGDGNSQHDGQPRFCQNVDTKDFLKNCDCMPKMGDPECKSGGGGGESAKCSVFCRKKSCRCSPDCGHTE